MNVLIVGNDARAMEFLALAVRHVSLLPLMAHGPQEALTIHEHSPARVILIEVSTSPDDLVHLCREIRPLVAVPIVAISRWADEYNVLRVYEAGADDCVVSPYVPAVLEAKLRAFLRLSGGIPPATLSTIERGAGRLDPEQHTFTTADGKTVRLTPLEFRLLYALILNTGHVVPSDTLVDKVWGYTGEGTRELLKGLVRRLRGKIEAEAHRPQLVRTVSGVGYAFSFEEDD